HDKRPYGSNEIAGGGALMRGLARWSYRHRRLVVLGWVLALVGVTLISKAVGTAYSNDFNLPHTESTDALALLQAAAPQQSGDSEQVVFATTGGAKVTDPAVQARIEPVLARVKALPHVSSVVSPFDPQGKGQISGDQTVAFAVVNLDRQTQDFSIAQAQTFVDSATSAAGDGLEISVSGQLAEMANNPAVGGTG